jgi:hypothetical protein
MNPGDEMPRRIPAIHDEAHSLIQNDEGLYSEAVRLQKRADRGLLSRRAAADRFHARHGATLTDMAGERVSKTAVRYAFHEGF